MYSYIINLFLRDRTRERDDSRRLKQNGKEAGLQMMKLEFNKKMKQSTMMLKINIHIKTFMNQTLHYKNKLIKF